MAASAMCGIVPLHLIFPKYFFDGRVHEASSAAHLMATALASSPLPPLPEGWTAEKDLKLLGRLSPTIQRNIEPVGPHFLAHARRVGAAIPISPHRPG